MWLGITVGGAITTVRISVSLLEDVHVLNIILTVVSKWRISDITLILGYILYIMFTGIVFIDCDFGVAKKP